MLDILLPIDESGARESTHSKSNMSGNDSWPGHEHLPDAHQSHELLFTVKPGGIAGHLGKPGTRQHMSYILADMRSQRRCIGTHQ